MTTETKTFISADEIVGITVECHSCKVKSHVQFAPDGWAKAVSERNVCPHCEKRWFITETDPIYVAIVNFVAALIEVRARTKELQRRAVPFSIALEITSDAFRASRDAG